MGDFPSESYDRWVTRSPNDTCDECGMTFNMCECNDGGENKN